VTVLYPVINCFIIPATDPNTPTVRMVSTQDDYSCYITIRNESSSDFLLADFGIDDNEGTWPMYQPFNTIEAHSTGTVHLKDRLGQHPHTQN
jgi:hypothetical protein